MTKPRAGETITCAIYSRISTRDKGQDVQNQVLKLEEFARAAGWTITHRYSDVASGGRADREQFLAMMEAANRREFGQVLFYSLDRFSREGVLETLQYLQRLSAAGVGWRSYTEQYLDSCGVFRDAVLSILATIAKQERIRIRERVNAGLDRARAAGRIGGRPKLIRDREMVCQMRAAGVPVREIAREVNTSEGWVRAVTKDIAVDLDSKMELQDGVRESRKWRRRAEAGKEVTP